MRTKKTPRYSQNGIRNTTIMKRIKIFENSKGEPSGFLRWCGVSIGVSKGGFSKKE